MDKRSWPWKKKSSDKSAAEKAIATLDSAGVSLQSNGIQNDKDNYKKPKYVQISMESYSHLSGLEDEVKAYKDEVKAYKDQVKAYEEQVKSYEDQFKTLEDQNNELHEQLSDAHAEITTKEEIVKQHSKVAEEAVSGWEKAEAEALTLKNHLEAVTLSKLTAEDRSAHLDGALKECMRQIRNLKEDHEHQIQDIVVSKNMQYDKLKRELEEKIGAYEQELLRAEADNEALSRSLKERSNMLIKINEEKSRAEGDIELLKSNVESCEREINSLKYELHIASKELEIRNEEKNMSVKSAEAANKQHMEGVKKIAKLEAECQRLRGLVRKKLPGPAALAQMKMEVEGFGRDYGDSRVRRSPVKPSSPLMSPSSHMLPVPEFSLDGMQNIHKENGFLTERLLAMEEETKMLKEALAKRNSELQSSRSMYAKAASKLQSLEAQPLISGEPKASPPSMTSMSEDGNDDAASCAESWASSHMKDKIKDRSSRTDSVKNLELMDDFLEMEKLASNGAVSRAAENKKSDVSCVFEEKHCSEEIPSPPSTHVLSQELAAAVSQIHGFVLYLGKEASGYHVVPEGTDSLGQRIEQLSTCFNKVLCNETSLSDFVLCLSMAMAKASELNFSFLGYKGNGAEANSPDCIDKVALPENMGPQGEKYENGFVHMSETSSNPEVPQEAIIARGLESSSFKYSSEEFELLKVEKENVDKVLGKCTEELEATKSQLLVLEQQLVEVKSQLDSSQNTNSLAETQLRCMAESYKSLEKRAADLSAEVDDLRSKVESSENELHAEKESHQEALARCKGLEEQLQRNEGCSVCSSLAADADVKNKQEKELADAAEKLAECQETIFLLGRQLKSFRPQAEFMGSPLDERSEMTGETFGGEEPTTSRTLQEHDQADMDTATSVNEKRKGDSPSDLYNAEYSPSDSEANGMLRSPSSSKNARHRTTKSGSSSASSTPTPEKQARGFSRFFSSKGKNSH